MSKKIIVIGAGISGLSTALLLREKDHHVTIIAKAFSPNITSNRAAAFWFPYHIRKDKRGIEWCNSSYDYYKEMTTNDATGISMKQLIKVIREGETEAENNWVEFMPAGSYRIMENKELPAGISKAYDTTVPLIETQIFLPYLMQTLKERNVNFIEKEIPHFDEVKNDFDIVINCSALGSRQLCNDKKIIAVRGQVALLSPDESLPIYLDNEKPLYVVPRKDAIIVGGTYEENIETENIEPSTIEKILKNAYEVFPQLTKHTIIGNWAGLRPYREEVRLEKEERTNIIHNYGHGGSGFTLAFGCAKEVADIVENL